MEYPEITQAELHKYLNNISYVLDQIMSNENYTEHCEEVKCV